jgi:hypothetical protein
MMYLRETCSEFSLTGMEIEPASWNFTNQTTIIPIQRVRKLRASMLLFSMTMPDY